MISKLNTFACGMVLQVILVIASTMSVQAIPITFEFSGIITTVNHSLAGIFSPGELITGSYTFESTAPNFNTQGPAFGAYNAITGYTSQVGPFTTMGSSGFIAVEHQLPPPNSTLGGPESYTVRVGNASGAAYSGFTPSGAEIILLNGLYDLSGSTNPAAFNSAALPLTPPNLSAFDTQRAGVSGISLDFLSGGNSQGGTIFGTLTSLKALPEPDSLLLLFSVLLCGVFFDVLHRRQENLKT